MLANTIDPTFSEIHTNRMNPIIFYHFRTTRNGQGSIKIKFFLCIIYLVIETFLIQFVTNININHLDKHKFKFEFGVTIWLLHSWMFMQG